VRRLLAVLLEDLADGLGVRALALNLREVGFPEAFAHKNEYPPGPRVETSPILSACRTG
jgi:hypothetical protein